MVFTSESIVHEEFYRWAKLSNKSHVKQSPSGFAIDCKHLAYGIYKTKVNLLRPQHQHEHKGHGKHNKED